MEEDRTYVSAIAIAFREFTRMTAASVRLERRRGMSIRPSRATAHTTACCQSDPARPARWDARRQPALPGLHAREAAQYVAQVGHQARRAVSSKRGA